MIRNKKLLSVIASLLLCSISYVITATPEGFFSVTAASNDDATVKSLESKIENVEKKLENLEQSIASTKSEISDEIVNKQTIDNKLSLVGESIDLAEQLINAYDNQIIEKQAEISDMEAFIEKRYGQFEEWIRAFYEHGELSYIEMIFDNESFNEVLSTAEYIAALINYQNNVMVKLEQANLKLISEKEGLEILQTEQQRTRSTLQQQKQSYEDLAEQSSNYLQTLRSNQAQYESEYKKALEEEKKLNEELEKELERIALQNAIYVGGEYIWPTEIAYKRITSYYGWRDFNGGEFHLGIDIPAAYGSNIYASNGGKVVKAESHYSYGEYILIDHGGGQATLYAHNSKLLVSVGDIVSQGDVIALAGSTGYSTGNHCHFEVRINGKTTNPLDYVSVPQ